MNIIQITPGAGAMYCGNCLRDNALVRELRGGGDDVLMVPVYLPLTLDEPDESKETPIFFSGINVYLEQKFPFFSKAPNFVRRMLASRTLLRWAAGGAAGTRAADLGELTLSMLRGEKGRQARESDELIAWIKTQPRPDVICLSNVLLVGMVRQLKQKVGVPVVCMLQGEDGFLDALPSSHRKACWGVLRERAADVDIFVATSKYFGNLMGTRLALPPNRVRIVYNGIDLNGYPAPGSEFTLQRTPPALSSESTLQGVPSPAPSFSGNTEKRMLKHELQTPKSAQASPQLGQHPPVLGYFARMCPEKGLDLVVDAFILLRQRLPLTKLKLRIGGSCGPSDESYVKTLRERVGQAGLLTEVEFLPNLDHAAKIDFFKSLTLFTVPARANEAFGLYVIEAMAAGVPVVQPRFAAFPELIEKTGGGVVFDGHDVISLTNALQEMLAHPEQARNLGETGHAAVFRDFSAKKMAAEMRIVFASIIKRDSGHPVSTENP
jgi:glycosyltransferase involved in cell wall biosynthesis